MGHSILQGEDAFQKEEKQIIEPQALQPQGKHLLFTTKTCPNCQIAYRMLDQAGIEYETIDAQEHEDLVRKYGIMQAPTLVVSDGKQSAVYANASNIQKYIHNQRS